MFHWPVYYPHVKVFLPWMTDVKDVSVYPELDIAPANELESMKGPDSDLLAMMTHVSHDNVVSLHRNGPVVFHKLSTWR